MTAELLVDGRLELSTPEHVFDEYQKHKKELQRKAKRTSDDFTLLLNGIRSIITIIPRSKIKKYLAKALRCTPDPSDAPYFAAAIHLCCPLWSNDKELKQQNIIPVYSTEELHKVLG